MTEKKPRKKITFRCTGVPERTCKTCGKKFKAYNSTREDGQSVPRTACSKLCANIGKRSYTKNEMFFSTPNPLNSYWAGVLAADGCILERDSAVRLGFAIDDIEHLKKFIKDVEWNGPIETFTQKKGFSNGNRFARVTICSSQEWIKGLSTWYSLTLRKSLTLDAPNLTDQECAIAYIAGQIDGDGCIGNYDGKLAVKISCGAKNVLEWIRERCEENYPSIKSKAVVGKAKRKKGEAPHWRYAIPSKIAMLMYKDIRRLNLPILERKWGICEGFKTKLEIRDMKKMTWKEEVETNIYPSLQQEEKMDENMSLCGSCDTDAKYIFNDSRRMCEDCKEEYFNGVVVESEDDLYWTLNGAKKMFADARTKKV